MMFPKRVHCIGVGGIGVSAVAKYLKLRGVSVSGSDAKESEITNEVKKLGVQVWHGTHPDKMGKDIGLVIYSAAVPEDDEERIRGRHLGAREVSYNAFLGELTDGHKTIAVTGTKGKSTTTALIGHVLKTAGRAPTVIVGSKSPAFSHGNLENGKDEVFVVEACEHMAHMLHIKPSIVVITNIAHDHPDFYKDVGAVREAMKKFAMSLPDSGTLVWNADDEESKTMMRKPNDLSCSVLSFGDEGDVSAFVERESGLQLLHIKYRGEVLGDINLRMPGVHNVQNVLAAIAVCLSQGVSYGDIKLAIESFPGLWRRFEKLGVWHGVDVYSDYAHNPMSIAGLIEGARSFLPNRRIVLCFEPHQHARTKGLFQEFIPAFDGADAIVISEIYGVAGRKEDEGNISSQDLVDAVRKHDINRGVSRAVEYAESLDDARGILDTTVKDGDTLLMAGAGNIDEWARGLVVCGNSSPKYGRLGGV